MPKSPTITSASVAYVGGKPVGVVTLEFDLRDTRNLRRVFEAEGVNLDDLEALGETLIDEDEAQHRAELARQQAVAVVPDADSPTE